MSDILYSLCVYNLLSYVQIQHSSHTLAGLFLVLEVDCFQLVVVDLIEFVGDSLARHVWHNLNHTRVVAQTVMSYALLDGLAVFVGMLGFGALDNLQAALFLYVADDECESP